MFDYNDFIIHSQLICFDISGNFLKVYEKERRISILNKLFTRLIKYARVLILIPYYHSRTLVIELHGNGLFLGYLDMFKLDFASSSIC